MYTSIVIIVTLLFICFIITQFAEHYNQLNYTFLTSTQTRDFFHQDKDKYIQDLTDLDVKAQKSKTREEYKQKIMKSASDFTKNEKERVMKAMKTADNALRTISIPGFNGKKASSLPWIVSLTRGTAYEDGLPHTRMNIIFISDKVLQNDSSQLAKVMMHEKVHVYERLFPEDMNIWLKTNGYKRYKQWKLFKRARSNPDIDNWAYLSPEGKPMIVEYTSSTPSTIHDVTYPEGHNYTKEHPNEVLAYGLEKYIK